MTEAIMTGLQTLIAQGGYTAAAVIAAYFVGRALIWVIVCWTFYRLADKASEVFLTHYKTSSSLKCQEISLVSEKVSNELTNSLRASLKALEKTLTQGVTELGESAQELLSASERLMNSETSQQAKAQPSQDGVGTSGTTSGNS